MMKMMMMMMIMMMMMMMMVMMMNLCSPSIEFDLPIVQLSSGYLQVTGQYHIIMRNLPYDVNLLSFFDIVQ